MPAPREQPNPGMPGARRCVIVTPERGGVPTEVPEDLLRALEQHRVAAEHAPSAYHAAVRVCAPHEDPAMIVLILVEPESNERAPDLALAAMTHAPDVSVWRFDPDDESPIAPYVPHKPGVVPDPIEPLPEAARGEEEPNEAESPENVDDEPEETPSGDEADQDKTDQDEPDDTPEPPRAESELALADAPASAPSAPTTPGDEPEGPLVSQDELDMLLGAPLGEGR